MFVNKCLYSTCFYTYYKFVAIYLIHSEGLWVKNHLLRCCKGARHGHTGNIFVYGSIPIYLLENNKIGLIRTKIVNKKACVVRIVCNNVCTTIITMCSNLLLLRTLLHF